MDEVGPGDGAASAGVVEPDGGAASVPHGGAQTAGGPGWRPSPKNAHGWRGALCLRAAGWWRGCGAGVVEA